MLRKYLKSLKIKYQKLQVNYDTLKEFFQKEVTYRNNLVNELEQKLEVYEQKINEFQEFQNSLKLFQDTYFKDMRVSEVKD